MRILNVYHGADLVNGVDRVTLTLAQALRARGVEAHALVPLAGTLSDRLAQLSFPLACMPLGCCDSMAPSARAAFFAQCARRVDRICDLIRDERIDVVHGNTGHALDAAIAAGLCEVPFLMHVHAPIEVDYARYAPLLSLAGYGAMLEALSSKIVAVSADVARSFGEHVSRDAIEVVYNGIDIEAVASQAAPRARSVREELRIPATAPLVLGVGRISKQKDFAAFARVARIVRDRKREVRFAVAGPREEQDAVDALEREIDRLSLGDSLMLLGPRDDVPRLMAESDVVLSTAIFEGFPLTTLEAMSLGRPVVAMSCSGLRETVSNGVDGLLVPLGDDPGAAAAVLRLLDEEALARQLSTNAKSSASARFSHAAFASRFLEVATAAVRLGPSRGRAAMAAFGHALLKQIAALQDRVTAQRSGGRRTLGGIGAVRRTLGF